jgi:transcriptional regulator with XRE-family HTH domain
MNPPQCRAARALLDWTQPQLAKAAKLGLSTVVDFEKERRTVSDDAVSAIRAALESAGAVFLDGGQEATGGPGVRLKRDFVAPVKLAAQGKHRGAYQRYIGGAPLIDPEDKQG